MDIKLLNKDQYLDSVTQMTHMGSLKFAKQAMDWWDTYYSWSNFPCVCLEVDGEDVCYLFYHISKNNDYLTIHNILTPYNFRFQGYAQSLLAKLFSTVHPNSSIQRVKMECVSSSLSFYMKLGIDFWGVNKLGQYYTNFPMPKDDIDQIPKLMYHETLEDLKNDELFRIYEKLKANGKNFDIQETIDFNADKKLLKQHYRFKEFEKMVYQYK